MTEKKLTVNCPACGTSIPWSTDNPWRPFCCERCKMLDLGAWASEQHAIPGDPTLAEGLPDTDPDASGN